MHALLPNPTPPAAQQPLYRPTFESQRLPIGEAVMLALPVTFFWLAVAGVLMAALPGWAWQAKVAVRQSDGVIMLGMLGIWRYSWYLTHMLRAFFYTYFVYPSLRATAFSDPNPYPERVYFLIPSFKEEPSVTVRSMRALANEFKLLPQIQFVVVATLGSDEEERLYKYLLEEEPGHLPNVRVAYQRQSRGKRHAMSDALRQVGRERHKDLTRLGLTPEQAYNDVVIFMDGDTEVSTGTVAHCIPFFKAFPKVGAVTTDEIGRIYKAPPLVREWFALKFVKRHAIMKSFSLSRKVLTLTGRYSAFRAAAVLTEEMATRLADDGIEHWVYGRIRFLMGDDKSTWYTLITRGWDMLYLPDSVVYSLETRTQPFFELAKSLMVRWNGNTLRTNGRALRLGPKRLGGMFVWWCVVDQRISMWTTLVAPVSIILMSLFVTPWFAVFYLIWIICVRLLQLWMLVLQGHRLRMVDMGLQLYDQWAGSWLKVTALFQLGKQRWGKAAGASQQAGGLIDKKLRWIPPYQITVSILALALFTGMITGTLPRPNIARFIAHFQDRATPVELGIVPVAAVEDLRTARAIQRAIDALPPEGGVVRLPEGRIELERPVEIRRDGVWVQGAGIGRTELVVTFGGRMEDDLAAIVVRGRKGRRVARLAEPAQEGDSSLRLDQAVELPPRALLWVGAPNTDAFLAELGATAWNREFPWLRQMLVPALGVAGQRLSIRDPLDLNLPVGTEVFVTEPVRGTRLEGFTVRHEVPAADPATTAMVYENLHPLFAVSSILFDWAEDAQVRNVRIEMTGRHAFVFENTYNLRGRHLEADGAWNKGAGGTGYVRFARSQEVHLYDLRVRGLRHVAFQWSASRNTIEGSHLEVDVNFHGGFSRYNRVRTTTVQPAAGHPWPAVYTTPNDAAWAPPDGPGNLVEN